MGAGTKIEILGCKPGGLCSKNILIVAVDWSGAPPNLSGLFISYTRGAEPRIQMEM